MKKHLIVVLALSTLCLYNLTSCDKHEQELNELQEEEANAVYTLSHSEIIGKTIYGASRYFNFEFTTSTTCTVHLTEHAEKMHYIFNKDASSSSIIKYKNIDNKTAHLEWSKPMIKKSLVDSKYDKYETLSGSTDLEFTSKGKGHTNGSEYGYNGNKYDTPYSFTIE